MTTKLFGFGQYLPEYDVPVLNERAVRAAAGILFFFAMVSFMNAWLVGNFAPIRVFVFAFLVDFTIRLFINPRYSPSMVVGQWLVRRQQPEWTGAPQKRFAWAIGFFLAVTMFYLVVIKGVVGPINLLICAVCLTFLLFESAFGICVGCWMYNRIRPEQAKLCPGGVCTYSPNPRDRLALGQMISVALFAGVLVFLAPSLMGSNHGSAHAVAETSSSPADIAEQERCKVPEFAKAIGHEDKWKLHNNCK
jgi:hypothetical protein